MIEQLLFSGVFQHHDDGCFVPKLGQLSRRGRPFAPWQVQQHLALVELFLLCLGPHNYQSMLKVQWHVHFVHEKLLNAKCAHPRHFQPFVFHVRLFETQWDVIRIVLFVAKCRVTFVSPRRVFLHDVCFSSIPTSTVTKGRIGLGKATIFVVQLYNTRSVVWESF